MRWTTIILTASSARQAEVYRQEIERRRKSGSLADGVQSLVVPDLEGRRMGSGGATIHALGVLAATVTRPASEWWSANRVLMIHSGGDSRRLPQYSPSGKLFGALPAADGTASTVFDEMLRRASEWVQRIPCGLLVASGDVVLSFDAEAVDWSRPGVTGVGMRESLDTGAHHGVYVADPGGRVYTFLQKPGATEIRAAGGVLEGECCAVDTGLLFFDSETARQVAELAEIRNPPAADLYEHFTKALTGQWQPEPGAGPFWRRLAAELRGVPFHCSVVDGRFLHVGTTRSFRAVASAGGGVLDSVLRGETSLGPESVVLECDLDGPVRAGRGAILHGLTGHPGGIEVPDDTVVHQVPILLANGRRATVIRVYGVEDDPKIAARSGTVTWFGKPMESALRDLGIDPAQVWRTVSGEERSLWNASLFPLSTPEEAWACARWMMGYGGDFGPRDWTRLDRLSLAESTVWADPQALAEARGRRFQAQWQTTAIALATAGTDLRPMLAHAPGHAALVLTGRELAQRAEALEPGNPTEAASLYVQAERFLERAGMAREADKSDAAAFLCVSRAVTSGCDGRRPALGELVRDFVTVEAPVRIDLGGGWSDTPPFCLDWGGTVLNIALELRGEYPISTTVRRIAEPLIRLSSDGAPAAEFRSVGELLAPAVPGSEYPIPRSALAVCGLLPEGAPLAGLLERIGGGLEIHTRVNVPVGSGLGTSSILSATVVRALEEIRGRSPDPSALTDAVMQLEQRMTAGGGWQDQAGGIYPGAKLLTSGPGPRQRIRVQPIAWSEQRREEFRQRLVLYYTGITRVAKNLLQQVVRSYLAREAATLQVLHSIKTLAMEMAHAMNEGDWPYLGSLLDRHWRLNQVLDPHTANAPILSLLDQVRPWVHGAKLAGAGGGGFLILLARNPENAARLREMLGAGIRDCSIAAEGLRVRGADPSPLRQNRNMIAYH